MTAQHDAALAPAPGITTEDLSRVSRTKVFFGHKSVGMNILDGVRDVYAAHGMTAPPIEEGRSQQGADTGFVDHAFIGANGKPLLKIQDFDAKMRSGTGEHVDVAMMKFCYVDINSGTDVNSLFGTYSKTMAALRGDFPGVTFIYVTVPLTTKPGLLSKLKSRLARLAGRGHTGLADNAARERLNALIRSECAGGNLFDLAAVESTAPDGTRASSNFHGEPCYQLYKGYASDNGHLNREGARVVATAWLKTIAQTAGN